MSCWLTSTWAQSKSILCRFRKRWVGHLPQELPQATVMVARQIEVRDLLNPLEKPASGKPGTTQEARRRQAENELYFRDTSVDSSASYVC